MPGIYAIHTNHKSRIISAAYGEKSTDNFGLTDICFCGNCNTINTSNRPNPCLVDVIEKIKTDCKKTHFERLLIISDSWLECHSLTMPANVYKLTLVNILIDKKWWRANQNVLTLAKVSYLIRTKRYKEAYEECHQSLIDLIDELRERPDEPANKRSKEKIKW